MGVPPSPSYVARVPLDRRSHQPKYDQLADRLRESIQDGRLPPGAVMPSYPALQQEHGLGRETVRMALKVLLSEGLVVREEGTGFIVRDLEVDSRQLVILEPGSRVRTRMPSSAERRDLDLEEGVPFIVVTGPDGAETEYPGDQVVLEVPVPRT